MKKVRYVVFDFNGTLCNDVNIALKACNHMLQYYKQPKVSLERFRKTFITPWINFYISNKVKREEINISVHQKEYQKIHTTLVEKLGLTLTTGASELLQFLNSQGVKLGVLSSRNKADLINELKKLHILTYFDTVVAENDILNDGTQAGKKGEELIELLRVTNPQQVLYIGDTTMDIAVARKHGFISGVITEGWQSKKRLIQANPDYLFKSFQEIKELFK